ncbi:type II toxin-antitoxin system RelB/DinJ family antitoxin [Lachnoanaerobaculum orale]|jgi:addiction module antitoxin, relB/dinJ family|uniref:Type II toxin-antitoxin system RelB/DinJ family antitoxin n=1 Tax=Lachnoanaerobaculum orale TaxID=979627 RepID=A0A3P3Q1I8_9FIRM|nr:type II toxin-antitoxin system RelB/DinJ family antitoxin [Lachnoanaerobaculum orale]RRJ14293.1 type II toxin-antitoxin system RelB/DinJ family antitoxin [Lachnoanaerobaculum orale]
MAQVSFRIDDKIKRDAEQVCDDIGISMSAAITIYLKRLGKERRIPFDLVADPFYSSKDIEVLDRRIADIKAGKNISEHELIEVQ